MDPPLLVSVPDERLVHELGDVANTVRVIRWDFTTPAPEPKIDIVVPPYMGSPKQLVRLREVTTRLVQSQSVGYDGVAEVLPPHVVFANAKSVHETSTAELAMALILASQRGIPDYVRASERGEWAHDERASLADRTVLLVGYGGIGRAIEARLLPFETTILRLGSSPRTDERGTIFGVDSLPELLGQADIVVVCVPLNDSTTHLIDDRFLSAVHDGGLLVNVSRGRVADTGALVAHAHSGRLRLALDVTDPEPLPTGHPLYALPNVLISPHVGGASSAMLPRMARLVHVQIDRMLTGRDPVNVVLRT